MEHEPPAEPAARHDLVIGGHTNSVGFALLTAFDARSREGAGGSVARRSSYHAGVMQASDVTPASRRFVRVALHQTSRDNT